MKQQIGDKVDRTNIILEGIERALQIQNRELQGIRQELTHQGAAIRRNSRDLRVIHQELINQRQRFGRVFSYSAAPQPGQQVWVFLIEKVWWKYKIYVWLIKSC